MKKQINFTSFALVSLLVTSMALCQGQELKPILLPKPRVESGRPLMQTLKDRKTTREFSPDKLPLQVVSDMLWAGFGVNRPESDHRTAPSAMNSQEIDLYVATTEGAYLYDAQANQLRPVITEDVRAKTGSQAFVRDAPVSIVYVADLDRLSRARPEEKEFYAAVDTGCIVQNVYLFCASEGLATVVHMVGDGSDLAKTLRLKSSQKVILAQAIGYPKR